MQISDFIAGTIAFIAVAIVCIGLMSDMYSPAHYNVDLTADDYTAKIANVWSDLNASQAQSDKASQEVYNKMAGENGSLINPSSGSTQSDVWTTAQQSLTKVGSYVNVMVGLFGSVGNALGFAETKIIMWYFVTTLFVMIALILIGIVFFRPL